MEAILTYLRKYGQRLDSEIAQGTGISIDAVRSQIDQLVTQGEVITCKVTRFEGEKVFEGILCRAAAFVPPSSPGRKPGAKPKS